MRGLQGYLLYEKHRLKRHPVDTINSVSLLAPAKLNLTLRVFGKRPDGYHDIRSLMVPVSLYDEISVALAPEGIEVASDREGVPVGADNSCGRAASLFMAWAGVPSGVRVRIRKSIPTEAGLGGGSSDAAATFKALSALTGVEPPPDALRAMAAQVGADVPFFTLGGAALAEGIGERLTPLAWRVPFHAVIVKPPFGMPTPEGYARLGRKPGEPPADAGGFEPPGDFDALAACVGNDFEAAWAGVYPQVDAIKSELRAAGASAAALTGSGSAVFGLFRDEGGAATAHEALSRPEDGRSVFRVRNI
jgi:4-diphosphocytidyl-2-C-methyl-D-erythritol kinase